MSDYGEEQGVPTDKALADWQIILQLLQTHAHCSRSGGSRQNRTFTRVLLMKIYKVYPNPTHRYNIGFVQSFEQEPQIGQVYEVDKQHQGHLSSNCEKMRITHIDEVDEDSDEYKAFIEKHVMEALDEPPVYGRKALFSLFKVRADMIRE